MHIDIGAATSRAHAALHGAASSVAEAPLFSDGVAHNAVERAIDDAVRK